ncbi:hypothetical protein [Clostridium sp. FP1]|nr:hypothetical protein [Clostridium sp. FP1]
MVSREHAVGFVKYLYEIFEKQSKETTALKCEEFFHEINISS